jgi:phospholipid/cholesterol/gamma-HCH transport system substrate-binding protein
MRITALKFGAFAVASLLVMLVLANTMNNGVSGGTRAYEADFTSVSGLRPGDDVRAAGVKVGRVQSIGLHDNSRARVNFVLSNDQSIYDTTTMVVRYQNLLGQRYLALVPGETRGTRLPDHALVPAARTNPGFDLTSLLNGFEPLFATLEPDQVNQLASSIISVVQGEGGTLNSLLTETSTLTNNLADKDEVLGAVLDNLTPVMRNLAEHGQEFDTTVRELQALMTRLAKERTTIGSSIDGVSALSKATSSLVAEARPDFSKDVSSLNKMAALFARERKSVTSVLKTLPTTTAAFARPMSYGTWLNMYICNMGVDLAGSKINVGSTLGPYSAACR